MNRVTQFFLAVVAAAVVAGPAAAAKKAAVYLKAERAGWMMGMYVGEKKDSPFPFILQVDKGSDAYIKGVREGDEIIRFNNEEVQPTWRMFDAVNRSRPGREIVVWVRRGAEQHRFFIRVPKDPGAPPAEKVDQETVKKDDEQSAEGEDKKKKKKKKGPVVVKPIPTEGN